MLSAATLDWDAGTNAAGTAWFTNTSPTGGDYYFQIRTQEATNGVWRTLLDVTEGKADLDLAQGWLPTTGSYYHKSDAPGLEEVLLYNYQVAPDQDWFMLVHATPGAQ
jgi:hypothetical protein